jgi:hypothetical protein
MVSRILARLITGPSGHFVAGSIDVAALLVHLLRARITGRDPW